ncbi:GtrA-like protein [Leptospira ryugenii]|uniref:GtrA-like protein n=1 Tax=Leptospira ryugenii TaxID=1917863 RepID=A0A2P2DW48_9LEPT|nr:glycosyltransferase [Leptospira ryugenii]GBF48864.1 GtrA-like protein [Leptospira ryugenii]
MFSLILPTYNERENLSVYLPKLEEFFKKQKIDYEIIVVDDDSPDKTWEFVQKYSHSHSNVKVIRRVKEKGLSSAVIAGMASARGDFLGVMDADMQHDESIIPEMLSELKDKEIVIGSRRVGEGSYGEMKWHRRILSYGATLLAKILLPIASTDPMSGFFIIRRQVFEESKDALNPLGFKILLEFLAKNPKSKVTEVGYRFKKREFGETKLTGAVMQQYIFALIDLRFGKFISLQFLKYALTGISGIFVNLSGQWLAANYLNSFQFNWVGKDILVPSFAVAFGFELSVLSNYVINNFWTFSDKAKKRIPSFLFGFLKFNIVSLLGFLIQYSTWLFLFQTIHTFYPEFMPDTLTYVANLIGILVATATNYQLNRSITWG